MTNTPETDQLPDISEDIRQEREIFFNIINRFIGFYTRQIQRKTKNDTSFEYPFVAMDTRQVYDEIRFTSYYLARNRGQAGVKHTFLDVGCGIGNILLIAEQFGFDVFGLEKDDLPSKIASQLIGEDRIIKADIRTYKEYDAYDVVYYFCPLTDGQRKFEKYIEDRIAPGTILIANYKRSHAIKDDPRFVRINSKYPIWQKVSA